MKISSMKVDIVDTMLRNTLVQDTTTKAVLGVRNAKDAGYIRGVTPHLEGKNVYVVTICAPAQIKCHFITQ